MREKIIVALDVETEQEALSLTATLGSYVGAFKVGLQLYNNGGPAMVKKLADSGIKIFLDLKFHDIPNTTARAAEAVVGLGAFMFNVHAAGGKKMMADTAAAAKKRAEKLGVAAPLLLGVTVLTSMSSEEMREEIGVSRPLEEQVASLARLCLDAGLDGVVAAAGEIPYIRAVCGNNFLIVTPGIRPAWAAGNDQSRVATPKEALRLGADYLVIGRPLTAASHPLEAVKRLLLELEG
ncbi:MAG: orotidine-5'-phosphate decarboxylase [Clostridium sp.]|nr:orotidine-5'-phosphate decarboxylase [Clostridium sp.]